MLNYPSKAHSILREAANLQATSDAHMGKIVRGLELFGEVLVIHCDSCLVAVV